MVELSDRQARKGGASQEDGLGQRMRRALEGQRQQGLAQQPPLPRASLMMSKARRAMFSELCRRPCQTSGELARALGTSRANAVWHLSKLIGVGLVTRARLGGRWAYRAAGHLTDEEARLFSALSNPATLRTFHKVKERPGATQAGLSKAIGVPRQALSWHLEKLERAGLIVPLRDGRSIRYKATRLFDQLARARQGSLGRFKASLMKALKEDNVEPSIVKALSGSLLVRMAAGEGTTVMEVVTDPFGQLPNAREKAKNLTRNAK